MVYVVAVLINFILDYRIRMGLGLFSLQCSFCSHSPAFSWVGGGDGSCMMMMTIVSVA